MTTSDTVALMAAGHKERSPLFEDCRQSVEWGSRLRWGGFSFEHSAAAKDDGGVPALRVRLHDVLEEGLALRFQSLIIESWEKGALEE